MSFILIYITHATEKEADQLVQHLLQKKLIACANIFPISSAYWWKGGIEQGGEWVSIVKTIPDLWEPLVKEVEKAHPYDLPCIMKLEVAANKAYEDWIHQTVRSSASAP